MSSHIKFKFTSPREVAGYSRAEISCVPSNNIPHALNSKEDIILKQSIEYYECQRIARANFVSGSPCMIPFCIFSLKSDHMKMLSYRIVAHIYNRKYKFAGFTLHKNAHFTAVVFWCGSKYFCDGLQFSDKTCLRPVKGVDLKRQDASYATYL